MHHDPTLVSPFGRRTIDTQRLGANGADSYFKQPASTAASFVPWFLVSNEAGPGVTDPRATRKRTHGWC